VRRPRRSAAAYHREHRDAQDRHRRCAGAQGLGLTAGFGNVWAGCTLDARKGPGLITMANQTAAAEGRLALKFVGVSLVGFAIDAMLLHLGVAAGLSAAWARLISLACAMQVTFVLNGMQVFRTFNRAAWSGQWGRYMLSNGFGNFCNYWIFVTLVSTHWPIASNRMFALAVGAFCAWIMNFASARFFVFGRARLARARPAKPGSIDQEA
jgi:putative flippase GtrA